jgi:hypothetical protein
MGRYTGRGVRGRGKDLLSASQKLFQETGLINEPGERER